MVFMECYETLLRLGAYLLYQIEKAEYLSQKMIFDIF